LPITFSQIADGGDLEPQMFGLTTKFNKMQEVTIKNENPAIGNVLLADVKRLIKLHGDINSLTLMRALKIPYATALDAIIQFEMDGAIVRKGNGRYRLNFR
jgi:hypothetical protein